MESKSELHHRVDQQSRQVSRHTNHQSHLHPTYLSVSSRAPQQVLSLFSVDICQKSVLDFHKSNKPKSVYLFHLGSTPKYSNLYLNLISLCLAPKFLCLFLVQKCFQNPYLSPWCESSSGGFLPLPFLSPFSMASFARELFESLPFLPLHLPT